MEYKSFADEFIKIAGSARDLYMQEKADKDFKSLMESSKPGAAPKAFAKGFAAGAAIPMFISANLHLSSPGNLSKAKSTVRRLHVAEALTKFKVVKPHQVAAALDHAAFSGSGGARGMMDDALRSARFSMDAHISSGDLTGLSEKSMGPAVDRFAKYRSTEKKLMGFGGVEARRLARERVYPHPTRAATAEEVKRLEEIGRGLYKAKHGRYASPGKMYASNFLRSMGRSVKAPLLVGAIAGTLAAKGSRSRQRTLSDIQKRSRGRK